MKGTDMTTKTKTEVKPAKVARYAAGGWADDAKIRVLVKGNPKKGASAERFAKYKTGLTVAKAKGLGLTPGDLRWDVAHAFIAIG